MRTVTLLGAAGIGKTRLVRDFLVRMRPRTDPGAARLPRRRARSGRPRTASSRRVLRARFGIVEGMDPEAAKAQVRAQVAVVLEDRKVGDVVYFLGQLLDLEFLDSPLIKAVEGDPQQLRQLRRAVIKRFLEADAQHLVESAGTPPSLSSTSAQNAVARGPIVLVFDDLHLAHEESLNLLAYLVEYLAAPVLILCLARPEMVVRHDGWAKHGGARHRVLELSPLCGDRRVGGDAGSPRAVRRRARPPRISSTRRARSPAATPRCSSRWSASSTTWACSRSRTSSPKTRSWTIHVDKLASVRLPITVEDAVQARIAALAPPERRAARARGDDGRGLLARGLARDAPARVAAAGYLGTTESPPRPPRAARDLARAHASATTSCACRTARSPSDEEYVFKHNLERETLLKLTPPGTAAPLPRGRRRLARVARSTSRRTRSTLGMLARHCEAAGRKTQAARRVPRGGRRRARAATRNAKSRRLLQAAGSTSPRGGAEVDAEARLRALHHYGDVLQVLGKNDEALLAFREMLSRRLPARPAHASGGAAHGRIGRLYRDTGRLDEASRASRTPPSSSSSRRATSAASRATVDDIGKLHWLRGDYAQALEHTQRALGMRRTHRRPPHDRALAQQPGPRLPGLGAVQAGARRLRAGARASAARSAISWRRDLAQQPRHRRAGPARRSQGARALPRGLRGRQGDRRSQPHRARPHEPRRDATTASATRRRRSST